MPKFKDEGCCCCIWFSKRNFKLKMSFTSLILSKYWRWSFGKQTWSELLQAPQGSRQHAPEIELAKENQRQVHFSSPARMQANDPRPVGRKTLRNNWITGRIAVIRHVSDLESKLFRNLIYMRTNQSTCHFCRSIPSWQDSSLNLLAKYGCLPCWRIHPNMYAEPSTKVSIHADKITNKSTKPKLQERNDVWGIRTLDERLELFEYSTESNNNLDVVVDSNFLLCFG